jgi:hypothetical protein
MYFGTGYEFTSCVLQTPFEPTLQVAFSGFRTCEHSSFYSWWSDVQQSC